MGQVMSKPAHSCCGFQRHYLGLILEEKIMMASKYGRIGKCCSYCREGASKGVLGRYKCVSRTFSRIVMEQSFCDLRNITEVHRSCAEAKVGQSRIGTRVLCRKRSVNGSTQSYSGRRIDRCVIRQSHHQQTRDGIPWI